MSTHAMSLPRPTRRARLCASRALVCSLLVLLVSFAAAAQPLQLVHLAEGRLTVAAHDAALRALVEEISRESGLLLEGEDALQGEVTVRFRRQTVEDGLALILSGWRYTFTSEPRVAPDGSPALPLTRLRVLGPRAAFAAPGGAAPWAPDQVPDPLSDRGVDRTSRQTLDTLEVIAALLASADLTDVRRAGLAALRDPDREVRATAVRALAARGGDDAVGLLELALRDPELGIRRDAIEALREIGGDRAARGLTAALHDRAGHLRLQAVDALGAIGGPTAVQLLDYVQAVDRDATVRAAAVEHLAVLRAGR